MKFGRVWVEEPRHSEVVLAKKKLPGTSIEARVIHEDDVCMNI